ncbi:uncharacterized protein LOC127288476 [Leptopilina boulardi]|uniref:uncharacterized protein LOC127288476 n=1 Tax=Leptopilina boulardi TaxID=63433 RepID=UPI0021F6088A|nr:uncharacterized protein LOC127288476 [Leptopilina boulardi]
MEELQEKVRLLTEQLQVANDANAAFVANAVQNENAVQQNLGDVNNQQVNADVHVDAVYNRRIRVPKFYQNNPVIWFNVVEAVFRNNNIRSEKSRADTVIAELDADVALSIADLLALETVPADIYQRIKSRLISTYSASSEAQLRKLLKGEVLNSGKPSHMLSRLRNLSGGKCSDDILKTIFLDQLPSQYRAILASLPFDSLDNLALSADKIADATDSLSNHVASIDPTPTDTKGFEAKLDQITAEIASIKSKFENSENNNHRYSQRSRSRSRRNNSRSHSRGNSFNREKSGLCWYHKKFKKSAKACVEPCSWVNKVEKKSEN